MYLTKRVSQFAAVTALIMGPCCRNVSWSIEKSDSAFMLMTLLYRIDKANPWRKYCSLSKGSAKVVQASDEGSSWGVSEGITMGRPTSPCGDHPSNVLILAQRKREISAEGR